MRTVSSIVLLLTLTGQDMVFIIFVLNFEFPDLSKNDPARLGELLLFCELKEPTIHSQKGDASVIQPNPCCF